MDKTATVESCKLTCEQIENLRGVFSITIGPYALICPKEQIQAMHDKLQERIDNG